MQVSSFPATWMVRGRGFRELHEDDGPHQGSGDGGGGNGGDGDRCSRTPRDSGCNQAGGGGIKDHDGQKTLFAPLLSSAAAQKLPAPIICQRAVIWLQLRPSGDHPL
ncbi:hypothetical protein JY409_01850 [Stenotrophomonas maltophilia]|nr:hypothetical protein [Stenotrophomonas maltophilia]